MPIILPQIPNTRRWDQKKAGTATVFYPATYMDIPPGALPVVCYAVGWTLQVRRVIT
jgi:hypothetical protein